MTRIRDPLPHLNPLRYRRGKASSRVRLRIIKKYPLNKFTTIGIGGPAKYFIVAETEKDLTEAIAFARRQKLPWYVLGEASNMIVSDEGFRGVIIQNKIKKLELPSPLFIKEGRGEFKITVGAGNNLLNLIFKLNKLGLSGLERMAGIPGTVGGAIYGSAGAYGQELKDVLTRIRFFDGRRFRSLSRKQCRFGYRTSIFKKRKKWVITEAELKLGRVSPTELAKISKGIIKLRAIKYKPGLKCPGSFFKNLKAKDIKITAELMPAVVYGKLPAGYLLEAVGAKGMKAGNIRVASHHANLIYNGGDGRAADVKKLASRLKALVKKRFGIIIDEEVQYL